VNIVIRTQQINRNEELRQYVERCIEFAMDRHQDRVDQISVNLSDLNGPRGGIDKLCLMTADIRGAQPVRIQEKGEDLEGVLYRAARRLAYRVGKRVHHKRMPHQREYRHTIRAA
jgi:hypothetical protein